VRRGYSRPERGGLPRLIRSQLTSLVVPTKFGWDGHVFKADEARIYRVVEKMVRGLYYHHSGTVLPPETPVLVTPGDFLDPAKALQDTADLWRSLSGQSLGGTVLSYRYGIAQDRPTASMWFLFFYQSAFFRVVTGVTKDDFEDDNY